MKYGVGDTFIYLTMETFKVSKVDDIKKEYAIDVFDENGELDREQIFIQTDLENDSIWEQVC
ncbi:hypothetical protein [Paenibacillus sp. FSL H3-0333]|uniref:hypothetical protein n=1 Tax=Paenibacillus sp. FSL H3-0333 TaxID=2921373 RepID=UPI0030FA7153